MILSFLSALGVTGTVVCCLAVWIPHQVAGRDFKRHRENYQGLRDRYASNDIDEVEFEAQMLYLTDDLQRLNQTFTDRRPRDKKIAWTALGFFLLVVFTAVAQ